MYLLSKIFDKLTEWSNQLKEFMINNDKSVIVFTSLFLVGIIIFAIAFSYLHKGDN